MTSLERKEGRYQRRKATREAKKIVRYEACDDFEKVFSYGNLYTAYRKCRSNVSWKASVQRYITMAPMQVYKVQKELMEGTFRSSGFSEFDIMERGKLRHIWAVDMRERVVQRCLCDNCLVPMLSRSFIYGNGASLKNKGYHFAARRLQVHLRKHYRQYGTEGYILLYDFSKFFDHISHEQIRTVLCRNITDERILRLCDHFIDAFGDVGMGLGSQVSQIFALVAGDAVDHFVKEFLGIRYYGRYMDDGYLIHRDKAYLRECLVRLREFCAGLGIELNERKTQIVKLSHGFVWLKARYYLTRTGKIIRKLPKNAVGRMRRKLWKLYGIMCCGKMDAFDFYQSYQSWRSYEEGFTAKRAVAKMDEVYDLILGGVQNGNDEDDIERWRCFGDRRIRISAPRCSGI